MPLPHRPIAVIFDMDGLIFDTEALYQDAFMAAAAAGGHDLPVHVAQSTIGGTWDKAREIMLDHFGPRFPVDGLFSEVTSQFDQLAATMLRLKPGVIELLDLLDELELPRCIATSSGHATAQSHLSAHGLADRFQTVIGFGDYAAGKPAPDPFLTAAARLGVDPGRCLALEDSHHGVYSASTAGMMTVMVPDLVAPTPEIRSLCAAVVSDLHAVCALILAAPASGAHAYPGA